MVNGSITVNGRAGAKKAVEALEGCLSRVPSLKVRRVKARVAVRGLGFEPDALLEARWDRRKATLVGEYKGVGQPRVAREAVNQLVRARAALGDAYGVFMAPYVSPAAAEVCAREGVGYVDLAGNCRLAFGPVFISREGRPNPFAERRDLRSLYSPRAERVLRVSLTDPRRRWKTRPLAREAEVSVGQVSKVRKLLDDREWLKEEATGVSLAEPGKLLAEWSGSYDPRRSEPTECYGLGEVAEIESKLADACRGRREPYAFTQFSAAARLAPSVRYRRAAVYVTAPAAKVVRDAGLKPVDSGANVTIITPYDEGVYYGAREVGGARVVSPVQAYLDLRGVKGRGEEAAEFLLETEIRPAWQAAPSGRPKVPTDRAVATTRKKR